MELSFFLSSLALVLVILNSLTMRVVKDKAAEINQSVSILVPMRNEEGNVSGSISSLLKQRGLNDSEIVVLNDHSTDKTESELAKFSNIKVFF